MAPSTGKNPPGEDTPRSGPATTGPGPEPLEPPPKKETARRDIVVPEIHRTGKYTVTVKLHSEVTAEINLEVVGY